MRLAEFILRNMEPLLAEWEVFAATLLPGAEGMTSLALRDHAQQMLEAVAKDLSTPQSAEAQAEKSRGRAKTIPGATETAAQTHAVLRARSGFDVNQLVAEYRALRASVLRQWMATCSMEQVGLEDLIRFNEAIDQAVAESVGHYDAQVQQARDLLLGMLGHDMRSPLNSIVATASYLAALNAGEQVSEAAARLIRSGASMQALLDDLVDYNRTRLGLGLKIAPTRTELSAVAADELDQLRGAYPDKQIELAISGTNDGDWDGRRLQQLLRNLVINAIRYGTPGSPVRVLLDGSESRVVLAVTNAGTVAPDAREHIFEPLHRASLKHDASGLGLGLFIVREIARAHRGDVQVKCTEKDTTFTVILPRRTQEHTG